MVWQGFYQLRRQNEKSLLFSQLIWRLIILREAVFRLLIPRILLLLLWALYALYFFSCTFKDHFPSNALEFISPNLPLPDAVN